MGIIFFFGGFLYLYLVYRSPCQRFLEMKERKDKNGMQGRVKPPPVRGVCGYSYLGVSCVGSWLSRGDSILLFVPCGPGSVRGCDSVSAILLCYVAFVLVPVDRHRWARFFWLVAGTNARRCSFGCVYASWVGRFWSLFLVLFFVYMLFDKGELIIFYHNSRQGLLCIRYRYKNPPKQKNNPHLFPLHHSRIEPTPSQHIDSTFLIHKKSRTP